MAGWQSSGSGNTAGITGTEQQVLPEQHGETNGETNSENFRMRVGCYYGPMEMPMSVFPFNGYILKGNVPIGISIIINIGANTGIHRILCRGSRRNRQE